VLVRIEQRGQLDEIDVPTAANPTSAPAPATVAATKAPPAADSAGGAAIGFCGAFKELQEATTANDPAALAAAFQASAADMRKYAPPEIKGAAGTYADLIESIAKSAQGNTMDQAGLQKALADGLAGKSGDIAKVAIWVSTNCKL
jgi:hypothetical protein